MIYAQNILKREPTELVRRVFEAQNKNPTEGDYINLLQEDFELAKIPYNESAIIAMGQEEYKKYIKKHIKNAAFAHLQNLEATHSKVEQIKYKTLDTQPYLTNSNFTNQEAALLIALRSHTLRGIKMNFSSWYKPDLACPLKCEESQDSHEHLHLCKPVLDALSDNQKSAAEELNYNKIYGNLEEQKEAATIFLGLVNTREKLLEATKPTSGSSLDAAPPGGIRGL